MPMPQCIPAFAAAHANPYLLGCNDNATNKMKNCWQNRLLMLKQCQDFHDLHHTYRELHICIYLQQACLFFQCMSNKTTTIPAVKHMAIWCIAIQLPHSSVSCCLAECRVLTPLEMTCPCAPAMPLPSTRTQHLRSQDSSSCCSQSSPAHETRNLARQHVVPKKNKELKS